MVKELGNSTTTMYNELNVQETRQGHLYLYQPFESAQAIRLHPRGQADETNGVQFAINWFT